MFTQAKRLLFLYIAVPIMGMLFLCVVYLLPTDNIYENVVASRNYIYSSQNCINDALPDTNMDRWTNSLMVNQALCQTEDNILVEALEANYYITGELWEDHPHESLKTIIDGNRESLNIVSYERYWHGYLIFLKPLLFLFTLTDVVYINAIMHFILLFVIVYMLGKLRLPKLIFPYLVFYFSLSPMTVVYSFQYSVIYYITQTALLIILLCNKFLKEKNLYICFFTLVGMATSYFDLLTYPIVSLGIPLIVLLMVEDIDIWTTIKCSVAWAVGYVEMWGSKWLLGNIFLGKELIQSALGSIKYRSSSVSSDGITIDFLDVVIKNFDVYDNLIFKIGFLLIILLNVIMIIHHLKNKEKIKITKGIALLAVAFYPIMWYMVVKNHSHAHSWMIFRDLSIFFTAIAAIAAASSEKLYKKQ